MCVYLFVKGLGSSGCLSIQLMFMRYTYVTDFVQLLGCYDCCPLLGLQRSRILWQTTFFIQSWYGDGLCKQVLLIPHLLTLIFFFLSSFFFSFGKYETERIRLLVNEIENKLDNHNRKFGVGKTGDILLWLHAQYLYASFHMQFRC